jgi:hypothetical protein
MAARGLSRDFLVALAATATGHINLLSNLRPFAVISKCIILTQLNRGATIILARTRGAFPAHAALCASGVLRGPPLTGVADAMVRH